MGAGRKAPERQLDPEQVLLACAAFLNVPSTGRIWEDLVQHVSRALQVDWAFVSELAPGSGKDLRTIAVWHSGSIGANFTYDLSLSPCPSLFSAEACIISSKVLEVFPHPLLLEMKAESFARVGVLDSLGRVRGGVGVVHTRPLRHVNIVEAALRIFAFRASMEFEHTLADEKLFRELVEDRGDVPAR
jgi:hypothetical protein